MDVNPSMIFVSKYKDLFRIETQDFEEDFLENQSFRMFKTLLQDLQVSFLCFLKRDRIRFSSHFSKGPNMSSSSPTGYSK